jgi:two-component system sensor histidine kinase ChvG
MAWVTAIKKISLDTVRAGLGRAADILRGLVPRASSRLAQLILVANFVALGVLVVGMLALSETRRGLVTAKIGALRAQGELIANVLAEGASDGFPAPALRNDDARAILRQLYVSDDARVLIFDKSGAIVADSHLLASVVETTSLPPPGEAGPWTAESARSLPGRALDGFANVLRSPEERAALDRDLPLEVLQAIEGGVVEGVRRAEDGLRVVSVSIPIQPVRAVIGVVTIESYDLDTLIAAERRALLPFILIAALVTAMSSLALTMFIARPVRRLARAAHEARRAGGRRVKMPDLRARKDEIGELGVALSEMTETLYDRLDAIERFAADVAHELKNPLTSIRSAAETLPMAKDDERRGRLLAVIEADVGRLDRLITDISKASRVEAELAREHVGHFDLCGLLSELAGTYNESGREQAHINFESHVRNGQVLGREGPLGQVFRNLIDNAITFSPENSTIIISANRGHRQGSQWLVLTIDDEGPGIPAENLETVFERFYTERPKGAAFGTHSGLGLAISRQIVKAHGGHITASNRADDAGVLNGARFTVELPAAPAN